MHVYLFTNQKLNHWLEWQKAKMRNWLFRGHTTKRSLKSGGVTKPLWRSLTKEIYIAKLFKTPKHSLQYLESHATNKLQYALQGWWISQAKIKTFLFQKMTVEVQMTLIMMSQTRPSKSQYFIDKFSDLRCIIEIWYWV